jgi:hypothetical protein
MLYTTSFSNNGKFYANVVVEIIETTAKFVRVMYQENNLKLTLTKRIEEIQSL